ncbi:MAG: G1 family endopeptidase [Candidatus Marsarchaeota archaeon]|nr:G1 family endopeptidase [Candidatus Marsarchaeota archaeon]
MEAHKQAGETGKSENNENWEKRKSKAGGILQWTGKAAAGAVLSLAILMNSSFGAFSTAYAAGSAGITKPSQEIVQMQKNRLGISAHEVAFNPVPLKSGNWSGVYSLSKSKFIAVEATFVVPKLPAQKEFVLEKVWANPGGTTANGSNNTAGKKEHKTEYVKRLASMSVWAGIGGLAGKTLIQAGATVAVINGTEKAVAWTEILPANMEIINPSSFGVNPGDKIKVEIKKLGGGLGLNIWGIQLENLTTGKKFSDIVNYKSNGGSAEAVIEKWRLPVKHLKNGGEVNMVTKLPKFTKVQFSSFKVQEADPSKKIIEGELNMFKNKEQTSVKINRLDSTNCSFSVESYGRNINRKFLRGRQ